MGVFVKQHNGTPSLGQHEQRLWKNTLGPCHLALPFFGDLPVLVERRASSGHVRGRNEWRGPLNGLVFLSAIHQDGSMSLGQIDELDLTDDIIDRGSWLVHSGYFSQRSNSFPLHRAIAGTPPEGLTIDHSNGWRNDNSRDNLRYLTHSEQNFNSRVRIPSWGVATFTDRHKRYVRISLKLPVEDITWECDTISPELLDSLPSYETVRALLALGNDPVKRSNV